jgi:predicted O-methyltransferase YrrM
MSDQAKPKPPMTDINQPLAIAGAIIAGAELGVYRGLHAGPKTPAELAADIGAEAEGVERLLDVLCVADYVERADGGRYAAGPKAKAWLTPDSENDFSSYLLWMSGWWDMMARMPETIRAGARREVFFELLESQPDRATHFAGFMRARARLHADAIADLVKLPDGCKRLVDLGGSHGLHAIALCQRHPELEATLFDLPAALSDTPEILEKAGVAERVSIREGNYHSDDIGDGWNAALCYDLIHNHTPDENLALLKKVAGALAPGGTVVLHEIMRPDPPDSYNAMFSLSLYLNSRTRTHSYDEISAWMKEAGYRDITRVDLPPTGQSSILQGTVA